MRIGVVYSDYYKEIAEGLIDGVKSAADDRDCALEFFAVPGTFEIPLKIKLVSKEDFDGFIALGCVVQGETYHHEMINNSVANALMQLSLELEKPVGLGVLGVKNYEQAVARSTHDNNKGVEVFEAVWGLISNINK